MKDLDKMFDEEFVTPALIDGVKVNRLRPSIKDPKDIKSFIHTHYIPREEVLELVGEDKKVIENMLLDDRLFENHGLDGVKGYNQAKQDIREAIKNKV